jgi:hypothetical protein
MYALELTSEHGQEVAAGERFAFGENWARFLRELNDTRIGLAEQSVRDLTMLEDLKGLRFLDAGSGSGLFSLADAPSRRVGAFVRLRPRVRCVHA